MLSRWRRLVWAVILVTLILLAAACDQEVGEEEDLEDFHVTFPFESAIEYHPFYMARELGYFEEEGLQVGIDIADGSAAALQQLLAGNTDVAISAPGPFLQGIAVGQDLRWVYSYLYENIFTMVSLSDSGIASPEDLEGKTVGLSDLAGGEVPLIRAVLRDAGLTEGVDVDLVAIGDETALIVDSLRSGRVHAFSSDIYSVAAIGHAGVDLTVILPEEVVQYPSDGVVVQAEALDARRDVLEGFLRAVAKAIVFADANPPTAMDVTSTAAPEEFEDPGLAQAFWDATIEIRTPPPALRDDLIGSHFVSGYQVYHDYLLAGTEEEGALPRAVDLSEALDSSLLSGANDFDRAAIEEDARTYSDEG